jgi:hypothetical protein
LRIWDEEIEVELEIKSEYQTLNIDETISKFVGEGIKKRKTQDDYS